MKLTNFAFIFVGLLLNLSSASAAVNVNQYLHRLAQDLYHEPASLDEITNWTQSLTAGQTPLELVTKLFESGRYRAVLVDDIIQSYLRRDAFPADYNAAANFYAEGKDETDLTAIVVGSPEYWRLAGNTASGWAHQMYWDLVGRAPTTDELFEIRAALNQQRPPAVAAQIVRTKDSLTFWTTTLYATYLHRQPDAEGLAAWVKNLTDGMKRKEVRANFLSSEEYQNVSVTF